MAGKYVTLTDDNFKEVVQKSEQPVLVDFWAAWCGPCKMFAPTVEEIAEEFDGRAVVGKLDVDAAPSTAEQYGIMSIPTVLVFKNGNQVEKTVGAVSKAKLSEMISRNL